jgi:cytochrome c biogenesis protein CcdA/thiol-disulfide isomerase/thioredoxin
VTLLAIGFVAGLLTLVSPCILPVLPAVIAAGVTTGGRRRAMLIASGLALAFGTSALVSIRLLDALHLPLSTREHVAEVALFVLAASFIFPSIGALFERAFARISIRRSPAVDGSGFVLGATLGLLYLPCGGPVLSAITAVGQKNGSFGVDAVALTVAYSLGIAVPVFGLVLLTGRMTRMTGWLRVHGPQVRRAGGGLILASAVAITFGAASTLQSRTPSFAASIEAHLTSPASIRGDLQRISNPHESEQARQLQRSLATKPSSPALVPMADAVPTLSAADLPDYGKAPDFAGITRWINTSNGSPLSLARLRGKVVLVDFWTYSCINCRRSVPHVESWYQRYRSSGLVVVGVHTPEFDFEHVGGNVTAAVSRLGVTYPVAMDNDYATWNAWGNDSWPAEYLIDPSGTVRYGDVGEGDYGKMEAAIRALLTANGARLPPPTSVPDRTPEEATTPESYLGYERLQRYTGSPARVVHDVPTEYSFAGSLPSDHLSYDGTWTVEPQDILAGPGAQLRLNLTADDVYLVLGGAGVVSGTFDGQPLPVLHVSGVPTLYTVLSSSSRQHGVLQLEISPGVRAYDFTFG